MMIRIPQSADQGRPERSTKPSNWLASMMAKELTASVRKPAESQRQRG